jgi:hypothetical protein
LRQPKPGEALMGVSRLSIVVEDEDHLVVNINLY